MICLSDTGRQVREYRITPSFSTGLNYSWTRVRFDDQFIATLIDRDDHVIGAERFPRAFEFDAGDALRVDFEQYH